MNTMYNGLMKFNDVSATLEASFLQPGLKLPKDKNLYS